ncbi:Wzz/FepE/Etk N-terminal domain-containing protein [Microvirga massiliensis]|uniref:Wzz/FepE/Etk N-terminal domain-containing protein n=1 Tax=Microvirga massiliensis TaxID=1033741 RepID=UPI00062BAFF6|nr:Wzz/FepE/Etk N-terminal domain-containing protein [Microvirga massiliensis]
MLKPSPPVTTNSPVLSEARAEEALNFSAVFHFLRRQWLVIAASLLSVIGLGVGYVLATPPTYLARAYLLLDTKKLQVFQQQSVVGDLDFSGNSAALESQIEVVRSVDVARSVVDELGLADDPEFTGQVTSFFGSLSSALLQLLDWTTDMGSPEEAQVLSREQLTKLAVGYLRGNLQTRRVRSTYVIEVGIELLDPGKAARVANAVAQAYILDQTQSKQFTTKRAIDWLQERMEQLSRESIKAERAVQDYKTQNQIINLGGRPIDEQQLAEISSQLVLARTHTAEAKAKLERLQQVIASGGTDSMLADSLQSDILTTLRRQYVDKSWRAANLSTRYGSKHQAVVTLQAEIQQLEAAIMVELRRIAEGYRSDYDLALSRERTIQSRLVLLTRQNAGTRQAQASLQVLESTAQAYKQLHQSYVQRYMEATQQQSFTPTEARVLAPAEGAVKTHPIGSRILLMAGFLGLAVGAGIGYLRESLDRVFRTARQVQQLVGVECLGVLPAMPEKKRHQLNGGSAPPEREITQDLGVKRQVVLTPFSRFTETVRNVKVAADMSAVARDVQVIGIVSAVPNEGKSTIASNLAQLIAHSGRRALLIDADLRHPTLTHLMAPGAQCGLLDLLRDEKDESRKIADVVWHDPLTGLDFLPGVVGDGPSHTSEILSSAAMANLVQAAQAEYDYVVVDFPPLAPVVDAKAASPVIDAFVLVIEWGRTSPEIVSEALGSAEAVQSKLIGAVLNRANPTKLKQLEGYKGYDYHKYYSARGSSA